MNKVPMLTLGESSAKTAAGIVSDVANIVRRTEQARVIFKLCSVILDDGAAAAPGPIFTFAGTKALRFYRDEPGDLSP
jgi:hypothetical protein